MQPVMPMMNVIVISLVYFFPRLSKLFSDKFPLISHCPSAQRTMILFELAYFFCESMYSIHECSAAQVPFSLMKSITFNCKRFLYFESDWNRKGGKAMWINKHSLSAALTREAAGSTGRDPPANQNVRLPLNS